MGFRSLPASRGAGCQAALQMAILHRGSLAEQCSGSLALWHKGYLAFTLGLL